MELTLTDFTCALTRCLSLQCFILHSFQTNVRSVSFEIASLFVVSFYISR